MTTDEITPCLSCREIEYTWHHSSSDMIMTDAHITPTLVDGVNIELVYGISTLSGNRSISTVFQKTLTRDFQMARTIVYKLEAKCTIYINFGYIEPNI